MIGQSEDDTWNKGPAKTGNQSQPHEGPLAGWEPSVPQTTDRSKRHTSLGIPHSYTWHLFMQCSQSHIEILLKMHVSQSL